MRRNRALRLRKSHVGTGGSGTRPYGFGAERNLKRIHDPRESVLEIVLNLFYIAESAFAGWRPARAGAWRPGCLDIVRSPIGVRRARLASRGAKEKVPLGAAPAAKAKKSQGAPRAEANKSQGPGQGKPRCRARKSQAKPTKAKESQHSPAGCGRGERPAAFARNCPAFARESLQEPTFAYAARGRGGSPSPSAQPAFAQ